MGTPNQAPIYPLNPYAVNASLAAVTACTTRAPTATASLAAANISILVPASAGNGNGVRIDRIQVQACSSAFTAATAAQTVSIWLWDGTTAYMIDEILVTLTTPSTTAKAFNTFNTYTNLLLPPTFALYMSTSITTTASTTALSVTAFGGSY